MNKADWKIKIQQACEDAGTYRAFYDAVIDTLSELMEIRDITREQYVESGAEPVIQYTNKAGAENTVKNPILVTLNELNRDALAYWRDLGLTPAGYKKLNESIGGNSVKTFADL